MSQAIQAVETENLSLPPPRKKGNWFWEIIKNSTQAKVGLGVILFFVILGIFAPWIEPYSVHQQSGAVFCPPSTKHWLGCDDGGIDMTSLLIQGGRISLIVGFCATFVAMVLGGGIGIIAGYFGGGTDITLMRITDYFLVIPDVPLMIVLATLFGARLSIIILVIGILLWTGTARIIRAEVKSLRERVYVKRATALGSSNSRIIFRHVLPQVGPLLIANTVLTVAIAIFDETALSFLGLGDPTAITWGKIIEFGFLRTAVSAGAWWAIVPAGICVALVIMGCYWLGQSIEDALNPRLKVAHLSPRTFRLRPLVGRGSDAI
jgi:peptide/nickel transport system permease protein